jgi:hypothetical protein
LAKRRLAFPLLLSPNAEVREAFMQSIPVVTEGNVQYFYDEDDVRKVCSIMRCADFREDCIVLLRKRAMKCALCSSMLRLFDKPYRKMPLKRSR